MGRIKVKIVQPIADTGGITESRVEIEIGEGVVGFGTKS